jgi:hypothetical protein
MEYMESEAFFWGKVMERLLGDLAWIAMGEAKCREKPIVRDLPTHAYDASFRMDHGHYSMMPRVLLLAIYHFIHFFFCL